VAEHEHAKRQAADVDRPAGVHTPPGSGLEQMVMSLQRAAGNRAVASSLAAIADAGGREDALRVVGSPASTEAPAAGGVMQIAQTSTGFRAAGVTSLPAPGAPDVVIGAPLQQSNGTWQATVNPTQVTPDQATSLYPGAGVHDENPTSTGMAVHRHVTPAASSEIKRGEEEHLMDLEWARDLAYDRIADAVNRVAAGGPITGPSSADARSNAMNAVRTAVPPPSRWADGVDPITHWRRTYGQLVAVTRERDSNRWHNISTEIVMDAAVKRRLGLPVADELLRYIAGTTQVGQHGAPGQLVQDRYNGLPAGGAAAPAQQQGQPAAPAPTAGNSGNPSPPGDYEPPKDMVGVTQD